MEMKKPPKVEALNEIAEELMAALQNRNLRIKDIRYILKRMEALLECVVLREG